MTLSAADNRLLTQVGPGTPMGRLLRHYWFPVAVSAEIAVGSARPLEVLGERLVLFRGRNGGLGLLAEHCPHRGASLGYGSVEERGLRCPYHGWLFDSDGSCLEQPNEQEAHGFRRKVRQPSYRVREMGGMVFAFLGEAPAPEPPMFDLLVETDVEREIRTAVVPCNWLQIAENGLDPVHIEWLHGHYMNYRRSLVGEDSRYEVVAHEEISFDITDLGIVKRRRVEGQSYEEEDWSVGQLVLFPAAINISNRYFRSLQYRVPIDETRTWHVWYEVRDGENCVPGRIAVQQASVMNADDTFNLDTIDGQDVMAWVTQGPIADRSAEHLGSADSGLIMFRRLLFEQLKIVGRGDQPRWANLGAGGKTITLPRRRAGRPVLIER